MFQRLKGDVSIIKGSVLFTNPFLFHSLRASLGYPYMSELLAPQQSLPQPDDSDQVHLADSETISYMKLDLQYEPKSTNQVKQSKSVTLAHQRRMSVYSKRILARVLEQITEDDTQLREFYQLKVSSIVDDTNLDVVSAYSFAKRALRELSMVRWEFEDLETQEWYFISLLDSSKRRVGIKDGVITIVLNPELTPYFVKIAGQYSTYKLDSYMGCTPGMPCGSMRFFLPSRILAGGRYPWRSIGCSWTVGQSWISGASRKRTKKVTSSSNWPQPKT
jgi:hypothetical protein